MSKNLIGMLSPERRLEVITEAARALVVKHVAAGSSLGTFAKDVAREPFGGVKLADLLFPVSNGKSTLSEAEEAERIVAAWPKHPKQAVTPKKPVKASKKHGRRSPEQIEKLCATVLTCVKANPGLRCEALKAKLGLDGVDDALVRLRAAKKVKTKGNKRATAYTAVA